MKRRRFVVGPAIAALFVLLAAGALTGCGAKAAAAFGAAAPEPEELGQRDEASAPPASRAAEKQSAAEPSGDLQPVAASLAADTGAPPRRAEERRRTYSGFCRLEVDQVEERQRELARFAEENGGYVERSYEQTVVLRVPASRFAELFDKVLAFGEVLFQSVETLDVSDLFRDQEARLAVARSARQRLYALLERTADVKERLAILREIKRLSEEIERTLLALESLERQVAFSRITVELVPRLPAGEAGRAEIPFGWIAALDPVHGSVGLIRGRASLRLGEDFATLAERGGLRAESPEGTRVRLGSLDNQPRGDEVFWQKALVYHLGPYYREFEELEAGGFRAVLFTSKDREPFSYFVGVLVRKGHLYVLEAFFPDSEARERRLAAILTSAETIEFRGWRP